MLFVYLENNKLRNGEDGMVERDLQVSALSITRRAVFYFSVTVWRWPLKDRYTVKTYYGIKLFDVPHCNWRQIKFLVA